MAEFIKHIDIVGVIALLQFWLWPIWRRFFRKGQIEILPTDAIEVGYSGFGPTVGLTGTLRCINQDLFVNSMCLEVVRQKDDSRHSFDWGVFRSQKLTHMGEEAEFELPYGLMLNISQPKRYNIVFGDTDTRDDMQDIMREVKEAWSGLILDELQRRGILLKNGEREVIYKKYFEEFSQSQVHLDAYARLGRLCYWESGEYSLILKVYTSKPHQEFKKSWNFRLTEEQVKPIQSNVVKILADICGIPLPWGYNYAYPRYKQT
jgi:hypothetical protein